jgi:hypothetical protein
VGQVGAGAGNSAGGRELGITPQAISSGVEAAEQTAKGKGMDAQRKIEKAEEQLRQAELEALLEPVLAAGEGLQGKALFDAMYEKAQATIDRTYPGTNATLRALAAQHLTSLALVRVEPDN